MVSGPTPIDVDRFVRSTGIPYDETYRLLADERTRATIQALGVDADATLEHLADRVSRQTGEGLETTRLTLVHIVLPKLESHGLLTYDRTERRVSADRCEIRTDETLEDVAVSVGRS
ncbi:DUF7344 domain-containing protein [Natronobiforma cellulositropha]|uniref:DUF7344 domain-containing protein n=1 Tax=Natronobiforma cellulositropha TaxID=1679076 RepID=UPI0021D60E1D|nr:hypothetical protein [Natronobiforma cellulositropha]